MVFPLLAWLALLTTPAAQAHRLLPAVATLTLAEGGSLRVEVRANFEAVLAGVGPQHRDTDDSPAAREYDALRALPAPELAARIRERAGDYLDAVAVTIDGRRLALALVSVDVPPVGDVRRARLGTLTASATVPAGGAELRWHYAERLGSSAVRIVAGDDPPVTALLEPGVTSAPYTIGADYRAPGTWQVARTYTVLGFTHILPLGLDHILFVLGIFLLSTRLGPLLWQVTAFTVAHSITLSLALFGVVDLPPYIVEPLIAASIVYVGLENVLTRELKPWRVLVVFAFGLLHGLGFAGVLTELGLPDTERVTALVAFNVGVEGGQVAVIALALLAGGYWFRDAPWYRARVVVPGSLLIALIGAYWTLERTVA